jgi:hypothetical protein
LLWLQPGQIWPLASLAEALAVCRLSAGLLGRICGVRQAFGKPPLASLVPNLAAFPGLALTSREREWPSGRAFGRGRKLGILRMQASSGQPASGPNSNPDVRVIFSCPRCRVSGWAILPWLPIGRERARPLFQLAMGAGSFSWACARNPQGEAPTDVPADRRTSLRCFEQVGAGQRTSAKPIGDDVQCLCPRRCPDAGCFASCDALHRHPRRLASSQHRRCSPPAGREKRGPGPRRPWLSAEHI